MSILGYFRMASSALGALLVLLALRNAWRGYGSRRWPQTPGRITRSFVLVGDDGGGSDTYTPQIEYEYTVEGTDYRGRLLQHGQIGSWNRERAEQVIARYPSGANAIVFFDPRRPTTAVLSQGLSRGNLAIALAGLA